MKKTESTVDGGAVRRKPAAPMHPQIFCKVSRGDIATLANRKIGGNSVLVYLYLRTWVVKLGDSSGPVAPRLPSYAAIATEIGVARSTILRSLAQLEEAHLIERSKPSYGKVQISVANFGRIELDSADGDVQIDGKWSEKSDHLDDSGDGKWSENSDQYGPRTATNMVRELGPKEEKKIRRDTSSSSNTGGHIYKSEDVPLRGEDEENPLFNQSAENLPPPPTGPQPEFVSRLGNWLCTQAKVGPPSNAQLEILRGCLSAAWEDSRDKFTDRDWCDVIRARAESLAAKSDTGMGFLNAWKVEAERALIKKRSTEPGNTLSSKDDPGGFNETQRKNDIQKCRDRIVSAKSEAEYCEKMLDGCQPEQVEFWRAESDKATEAGREAQVALEKLSDHVT